jgi:hypothetical protein
MMKIKRKKKKKKERKKRKERKKDEKDKKTKQNLPCTKKPSGHKKEIKHKHMEHRKIKKRWDPDHTSNIKVIATT